MNPSPAVQPPHSVAQFCLSAVSNGCADHPSGDNRFSRKQLQPKAGAGFTAPQLPDLG
jgi:hypothetical protein